MFSNPHSCDDERREVLEQIRYLEPGLDGVLLIGKYFARVDDRSTTNNYKDLVVDATRFCPKMANPKLWVPINPSTNIDQLITELSLDWPKQASSEPSFNQSPKSQPSQRFNKKPLSASTNNNEGPKNNNSQNTNFATAESERPAIMDDERLKNTDQAIVERILNEIVDKKQDIKWDDIAGLENVKQAINEIVIYPMQNPELFNGLLTPAKGLLLFGPPGTGKTLIGKCIAAESNATFFSISASSLTSKWIGEGEKMVRALFTIARIMQPSVVFIDEIDSLLTQRVEGEHDSTRRMKTEFLVQFDGVATGSDDRLLIVGATNRPQELDEAARRRFTKRLYVMLPDQAARRQLIERLMSKAKSKLTEDCIKYIVEKTEGKSNCYDSFNHMSVYI